MLFGNSFLIFTKFNPRWMWQSSNTIGGEVTKELAVDSVCLTDPPHPCCKDTSKKWIILTLSCLTFNNFLSFVLYTLLFRYPRRKKSKDVRFDLADHSMNALLPFLKNAVMSQLESRCFYSEMVSSFLGETEGFFLFFLF